MIQFFLTGILPLTGSSSNTPNDTLPLDSDLRDWRMERQQTDGAAPATINRALSTLRRYCAWAVTAGMMTENAPGEIADVPTPALAPHGLPAEADDFGCVRGC